LEEVNGTLESFVEYNGGQTLDIEKIRNYQLAAGVYTTNKREFQQLKIDPYDNAIRLLLEAEDGIEKLLKDVQAGTGQSSDKEILQELQKQVIKDIANDYYTGYTIDSPATDFDKAIDYYTQLTALTENEDEIKDIYFRITDITREQGDKKKTVDAYEDLISRYSDSAKAYLDYASYMYEEGDLNKSAELYRKASACKDAEEDPNYERLGIKLRNAGALT
jgi:tetratricopeptide (TPR) repeat protein